MLHSITMRGNSKVPLDVQGLFNQTRAAEYLGITRMTLWRWTKAGKITAVYIGGRPIYPLGELIRLKEE